MTYKLIHYVQKSFYIGWRNTIKVFWIRFRFICTHSYWRYQILQNSKLQRWHSIQHKTAYLTYVIFFEHLKRKQLTFVLTMYDNNLCTQALIKTAQSCMHNEFAFLGSQLQRYDQIPWHKDFRLQQQNSSTDFTFDGSSFYSDLRIQQGVKDALAKDIKVPWELSRFQYLYVLGKAYEHTNEQCYVDAFQRYVSDWLDNNPYLCGINWQCPMEVGIRAINWIVAWEFFNPPSDKCYGETRRSWTNFRERFISSLYDHMIYLENNWEFYDSRTNNHYLSNLVAYLYLCWFFGDLPEIAKKRAWVVQEILSECEKQVFAEGTSYEGSTHYHRLVTELFYHAYLLFQAMDIQIPEHFRITLLRMVNFINWCTVNSTSMVSIGDNDSGNVLYYGLTPSVISQMQTKLQGPFALSRLRQGFVACSSSLQSGSLLSSCLQRIEESKGRPVYASTSSARTGSVAYFADFGLSVIKTNQWHITLRHHAYNALQPSGHFHNDVGSITLAVNSIPVIVDPGSFVYTPSVMWRNYFRSVAAHNTSFVSGVEPVPLSSELFVLNLPERLVDESPIVSDNSIRLHARHFLYKDLGLQFVRQLEVDDHGVQINDAWIAHNETQHITCNWNFTLAPDIVAHEQDNGWLLTYHQKPVLIVRSSDVVFTLHETWVSMSYGQKIKTQCLRASRALDDKNVVIECVKI